MKTSFPLLFLLSVFSFSMASCEEKVMNGKFKKDQEIIPEKHTLVTFGTGCYWCSEAIFQQLDGVVAVTSGFMGGHIPDPTYKAVSTGFTGHVEVIQIAFDPEKISLKTLLKWFWKSHDPTDGGGQGADRGPQYATTIFYHDDAQKKAAEESKKIAQAAFDKPIATKLRKAEEFYKAPTDHQDYYFQNKTKNRYCPAVIAPKLDQLNLEK